MRDIIFADTKRILRKPTYWILMCIALIASLIAGIVARRGAWNSISYISNQGMAFGIMGMILGISIFLGVYADEFTSNSMQCLIGRGISRFKLLAIKVADCVIVSFACFLLYGLFVILLGFIMDAGLNAYELKYIFGSVFSNTLCVIGFSTIAMIVLYATKNVALSTLVDVVLYFASLGIKSALGRIPVVKFLHLENHLVDNGLNIMLSDFMLGNGSLLGMVWKILRVCVISLIISYLFFRKKELDF